MRVARVERLARSEPAPGSLNSWHHEISPRKVGGIHRSCCSRVPYMMTGGSAHDPIMIPGRTTRAARNSSSITTCSAARAPRPHGAGHVGMMYPASAMRARCASGSSSAISATKERTSVRRLSTSGPRSTLRPRRSPARASSHARVRHRDEGPRRLRSAIARLRYMCASCSHVKPIPPSTCTQSLAFSKAASSARAIAVAAAKDAAEPSSSARAASQAAARASSTRQSMSAHRCFTPWNCPMGRPNWTRSLAYAAAVSTHHCATPTSSAAASAAVRSSTASPVTPSRQASASTRRPSTSTSATRRVASTLVSSRRVTRESARSIATQRTSSPTRHGATSRSARCAPTTGRTTPWMVRLPVASSPSRPHPGPPPTAPTVSPPASPGSSRFRAASLVDRATTAAARTDGSAGPGAIARPSSSTTTATSGIPNPDPPCATSTCRPSQPCAASSPQNTGSSSVSASRSARGAAGVQWRSIHPRTDSWSARWSSVIPIGIALGS